ncbi:MAG: acyl-ACP--UDP-N-acetylglucosamine O-acyltransferase [Spirochaetes bacterium]|nr:acyl-ACP--UDP-N-acetylglucosamine O-acyltransferase [Spirochaetota bacterium]
MIHNTAIIEGNVSLGKNVVIGPCAYLSGEIEIGDNTEIGHCVRIEGNVKIGKSNKIFHSAYIGAPPQDVAYQGAKTYVEIGNDNTLREFVQIHRATKEGTRTEVGSNCFLMGGVHLAHNVKLGNSITIANNTVLGGYVEVDDFTFISGLCGFHQFVKVGKYVMIGGLARINKDCIPYMIIEGSPPRVAGINVVGLRRREFSSERRQKIKEVYKLLCRSGKNVSQAVQELEANTDPDITEIINFIRSSDRGIIR